MTTLTSSINVKFTGTQAGTPDKGAVSHAVADSIARSFTNGVAVNQANQMFVDTRTVAGSSNDDIDLAGILIDQLGTTVTFTSIKALLITSDLANGDVLNVGAAAANGFSTMYGASTDLVKVHPGGLMLLSNPTAAGYIVTAGTGDILRVANADASSATYTIYLIGTV